MKIVTCQFVLSSDLFEGLDSLMEDFDNSDPPFSWGDNNHSLVSIKYILHHIDDSHIDNDQLSILQDRAEKLPERLNTLVDLEN